MENEKNKISEGHLEAVTGGNASESNDKGWEVHGYCPRCMQECYSYPCYYPGPNPVVYCVNCGSQLENVKVDPL